MMVVDDLSFSYVVFLGFETKITALSTHYVKRNTIEVLYATCETALKLKLHNY